MSRNFLSRISLKAIFTTLLWTWKPKYILSLSQTFHTQIWPCLCTKSLLFLTFQFLLSYSPSYQPWNPWCHCWSIICASWELLEEFYNFRFTESGKEGFKLISYLILSIICAFIICIFQVSYWNFNKQISYFCMLICSGWECLCLLWNTIIISIL